MATWQQGPSGSRVVKHGRESPTAAATAIAEDLALGANHVITELKALATAAAGQGSVGTLASLLQQLYSVALKELGPHRFDQLEECLALATKALKQSLEENVQMKATIEALQRKVEDLQRSVSELKHQEEDSRQSVLLGQLVYVLEDVVRVQVMGPKFPPTSLAGIQDLVADGFVSEEGRRKWNKFVTRLEEQGLSVRQVMTASTPLRRQRFAVAHGTMEERATVSTAQLREWASMRDLQPMAETILKVLQPLTCEGQPLLPRSDINDMFA